MPKNKRDQYAEKAKKLRYLGFNISYKGGRKNSPQKKAAVNRIWNKEAIFYATNPEKNRLIFKPYTEKNTKEKWKGYVSSAQIFPRGVFIQAPKGVNKKNFKFKLNPDGSASVYTTDGRVNDLTLRIDIQEFVNNPEKELKKLLSGKRRPKEFLLTVNGFDAGKNTFADLEQFNRYLQEELVPNLESAQFNFDQWRDQVFGLHVVYSPKGHEKSQGEGKLFNFSKGGIFGQSKKEYGKKKYENRENYRIKKGKRKGT